MRLATTAAMFIALAAGLSLAQAAKSEVTEVVLKNNRFTPDCVKIPADQKTATTWRSAR